MYLRKIFLFTSDKKLQFKLTQIIKTTTKWFHVIFFIQVWLVPVAHAVPPRTWFLTSFFSAFHGVGTIITAFMLIPWLAPHYSKRVSQVQSSYPCTNLLGSDCLFLWPSPVFQLHLESCSHLLFVLQRHWPISRSSNMLFLLLSQHMGFHAAFFLFAWLTHTQTSAPSLNFRTYNDIHQADKLSPYHMLSTHSVVLLCGDVLI